jgi:hypothetical protein
MAQVGRDLDLAQEAVGAEGVGQLRMEELERDRPAAAEVAGQLDRGHAAPAQLALESANARLSLHAQHARGMQPMAAIQ